MYIFKITLKCLWGEERCKYEYVVQVMLLSPKHQPICDVLIIMYHLKQHLLTSKHHWLG